MKIGKLDFASKRLDVWVHLAPLSFRPLDRGENKKLLNFLIGFGVIGAISSFTSKKNYHNIKLDSIKEIKDTLAVEEVP